MPENANIFFIGLGLGTILLILGGIVGYIVGRRATSKQEVDKKQFLDFLRELSSWTSEFSGDVSKYQSQLSSLSAEVGPKGAVNNDKLQALLSRIMNINEQLQHRLDTAEERLEEQTGQISSYLTEARTDALTGLFNRRAFDRSTDELYAAWSKSNESFSLCLLDIDHFKRINDSQGHQAGDEVLRQLGRQLQTEFADVRCIARYGGEEFAVLTKESGPVAAKRMDEFRSRIENLAIAFDGKEIPVTVSVGCAQIDAEDRIGNLVRRADEALYASKLGGRNRVHLHDATLCRLITEVSQAVEPESSLSETAAESRDKQQQQDRIQERLQRIVAEESRRVYDK